ncbi:hypothetical protein [Streptomyces sp. NPDC088847]|uniref:hypothetical protein n=1 Tax=Streptomyces sp. NPDC088847 TaxID=3365909 RepID=UPI0037F81768
MAQVITEEGSDGRSYVRRAMKGLAELGLAETNGKAGKHPIWNLTLAGQRALADGNELPPPTEGRHRSEGRSSRVRSARHCGDGHDPRLRRRRLPTRLRESSSSHTLIGAHWYEIGVDDPYVRRERYREPVGRWCPGRASPLREGGLPEPGDRAPGPRSRRRCARPRASRDWPRRPQLRAAVLPGPPLRRRLRGRERGISVPGGPLADGVSCGYRDDVGIVRGTVHSTGFRAAHRPLSTP